MQWSPPTLIENRPSEKAKRRALFRCHCGNEFVTGRSAGLNGHTKSCGCLNNVNKKPVKPIPVGSVFGRLTTIAEQKTVSTNRRSIECRCSCGAVVHVARRELVKGDTKSCGCLNRQKGVKQPIPIGTRFGRWVTLSKEEPVYAKDYGLLCRCDCGTERIVRRIHLYYGNSRSCGCGKVALSGPDHPFWDPTLSDSERLRRYNRHHIHGCEQLRIQAYERDGYTCAACKAVGGKLNAHHIMPWKHHPTLQFELANMLTLCSRCHKEIHNRLREDLDTGTDELDITTQWIKEKKDE